MGPPITDQGGAEGKQGQVSRRPHELTLVRERSYGFRGTRPAKDNAILTLPVYSSKTTIEVSAQDLTPSLQAA